MVKYYTNTILRRILLRPPAFLLYPPNGRFCPFTVFRFLRTEASYLLTHKSLSFAFQLEIRLSFITTIIGFCNNNRKLQLDGNAASPFNQLIAVGSCFVNTKCAAVSISMTEGLELIGLNSTRPGALMPSTIARCGSLSFDITTNYKNA
jgi:hypothetical protein